ncbi:MAG: FN3 domain-containing metallophosphoesterase family protein [Candidatus Eisenbacteria bacterium]
MKRFVRIGSAAALVALAGCGGDSNRGLPVDREAMEARFTEQEGARIENLFSLDQIQGAVRGGEGDLRADFSEVRVLLSGEEIDPAKIHGTVRVGPYPFEAEEADFAYKRFRVRHRLEGGKADLGAHFLMEEGLNSEGWTDGGRLSVRFDLRYERPGADRDLGLYDIFVDFRRSGETYEVLPSIVEGPFVALARSDDPGRVVVALRTSVPAPVRVLLGDGRTYVSRGGGLSHEIPVTGLDAAREYSYRVEVGGARSRSFPFRTAPKKGKGEVVFAYTGDSREGRGGGDEEFMGVNHRTLVNLTAVAYREGAMFFLMGGDLVNGYTTSPGDFAAQLRAWKQAVAGFGNSRPIYPCMGNHEALLRIFDLGEGKSAYLDRWPYDTESAEAVFAREFVNPENGPSRPTAAGPPTGKTSTPSSTGPSSASPSTTTTG